MAIRPYFVILHRWAGLLMAGFLVIAGLTGSVIAFQAELDRLLNMSWFTVAPVAAPLSPGELVARAEAWLPEARVTYLDLPQERTRAAVVWMEPRAAVGKALDYDEVMLHPGTGAVLGKRKWDAIIFDRAHVIPLIYKLHYSLHLGQWGIWIFGGVAMVWTFDCFVGLYLGWPRWNWPGIRRAFSVKWRAGATRVHFDLHRAAGLWFWLVLLVIAFSAVAMNLSREVFQPALSLFSPLTPEPAASWPTRSDPTAPLVFPLDRAIALATAHLHEKGIVGSFGGTRIDYVKGIYQLRFHTARDPMLEHPGTTVSISAERSKVLAVEIPGSGTAGDIINEWQYPLHSGKAFGLAGRLIICVTGLVTALLSITGVLIWWKKLRVARKRASSERSRALEMVES